MCCYDFVDYLCDVVVVGDVVKVVGVVVVYVDIDVVDVGIDYCCGMFC